MLAAAELIITTRKGSTSLLQRRRRIGFNFAAQLMETLHQHGIVGPARGCRARLVLVPADQLQPALDALRANTRGAEQEDTSA